MSKSGDFLNNYPRTSIGLMTGAEGALIGALYGSAYHSLKKPHDLAAGMSPEEYKSKRAKRVLTGAALGGVGGGLLGTGLMHHEMKNGKSSFSQHQGGHAEYQERVARTPFRKPAWAKKAKSQKAIKDLYRDMATTGHPDAGGDPKIWSKITAEYNAMKSHPEFQGMPKVGHLIPSMMDELHSISSSFL